MISEKLSIKYNPNSDTRAMRSAPTIEEIETATKIHFNNVSSVLTTLSISLETKSKKRDWSKNNDKYVNSYLASIAGKSPFEDSEYILYNALGEKKKKNSHDQNLFDIIEYIVDQNVMKRERDEKCDSVDISDDVLREAFNNTVNQIKNNLSVTL